jgi:hypothetical protein
MLTLAAVAVAAASAATEGAVSADLTILPTAVEEAARLEMADLRQRRPLLRAAAAELCQTEAPQRAGFGVEVGADRKDSMAVTAVQAVARAAVVVVAAETPVPSPGRVKVAMETMAAAAAAAAIN